MYRCSLCGLWYEFSHVCAAPAQGAYITYQTRTTPITTTLGIRSHLDGRPTRRATPEQEAEAQRQVEARHAKTREVEAKAKSLLLSLLSDEQQQTMEENNHIIEKSASGHRYLIQTGRHWTGNVRLLADDIGILAVAELCCHLFGRMPRFDQFAAQVLAIRFNEEEFIGVANIHQAWWNVPPEWFSKMRNDYRNSRKMRYLFDEGARGNVNVYYEDEPPTTEPRRTIRIEVA